MEVAAKPGDRRSLNPESGAIVSPVRDNLQTPAREGEEATMRLRFLLFAVAAFLSFSVHAQSTATLTGTLTDPSGGAFAAAQISAKPLPSGAPVETTSSAEGRYFLTLAPGRYRVSITHPSFARVEKEITLAAGESREWNVRMELEKLAATVIVTAEAEPTPATATTAPVTVLTRQEITQRQEIWLAPLLASAGGINLTRLGPMGGITTLFLDGGNSNFTKVLVDGTPANQPGGDVDFSNFTLDNV
jgi:vitamin B12 transporter